MKFVRMASFDLQGARAIANALKTNEEEQQQAQPEEEEKEQKEEIE